MDSNSISGVPRYFQPYVNDCFTNVLASYMEYKNLNPKILLADYLSFMYDEEEGVIGVNYLYKPYSTVMFTEEQLNTSLYFFYIPSTELYKPYRSSSDIKSCSLSEKDSSVLSEKNDTGKIQNRKEVIIHRYADEDNENAYTRTKELIDRGIPALVAVDMFHMSYHQAYEKEHGLHYIVITGYDEENSYYELFDKYKLASCDFDGKLPIKEIKTARMSKNPQNNVFYGSYERPIMNNWIEVENCGEFIIRCGDVTAIMDESLKRMHGQKTVLGIKCGTCMIEAFIKNLMQKKQEVLDASNHYFFKTYLNEAFKVTSRNRRRFKTFLKDADMLFPFGFDYDTENCFDEAAKFWEIASNLSYKLAATKNISIIDDICRQLTKAVEKEKYLTEKISDCMNRI